MSCVGTRRVRTLTAVQLAQLCGGVSSMVMAGSALLMAAGRSVVSTVRPSVVPASASAAIRSAVQQARCATSAAAIRSQTCAALAALPLALDAAQIEPALRVLEQAVDIPTAKEAAMSLGQAVLASHQQNVLTALTNACQQAARQVGFRSVEVSRPAADIVHVFAGNATGHGLVTEIRTDDHGAPVLETEAIGFASPRCEEVVAAFDAALARLGVHMDGGHKRRKEDGRVATKAAQIFFGRLRMRRSHVSVPAVETRPAPQRRQRVRRVQQRG